MDEQPRPPAAGDEVAPGARPRPIQLGEPIWVPMTETENRRAIEAIGALLAWAAIHPGEWQG